MFFRQGSAFILHHAEGDGHSPVDQAAAMTSARMLKVPILSLSIW